MDSDLDNFFREQEERFKITSEDEKEFEAYTAHIAARRKEKRKASIKTEIDTMSLGRSSIPGPRQPPIVPHATNTGDNGTIDETDANMSSSVERRTESAVQESEERVSMKRKSTADVDIFPSKRKVSFDTTRPESAPSRTPSNSHERNVSSSDVQERKIPQQTIAISDPGASHEVTRTSQHRISTLQSRVLNGPKPIPIAKVASTADTSNVTTPASTSTSHVDPTPSYSAASTSKPKKPRPTVNKRLTKAERALKLAAEQAKKAEQTAEKRMTPREYAEKLQTKFTSFLENAKPSKLYLRDFCIFYIGGDLNVSSVGTRAKMDFIRKHGGRLLPTFEPAIVTHIVTDAALRPTLKALCLKSLEDIPNDIPTVKWDWVVSGSSGRMAYEFMHAAFASRIDVEPRTSLAKGKSVKGHAKDKGKGKEKAREDEKSYQDANEFSRIEDFTEEEHNSSADEGVDEPPARPLSILLKPDAVSLREEPSDSSSHFTKNSDPLAEFYSKAKAEHEASMSDDDESDSASESFPSAPTGPKKGFVCDIVGGVKQGDCPNQDIINKLEELMELHRSKPSEEDRWRVFSYGKAIRAIRDYPKPIASLNEAQSIRGVGEKTARKIMEIIETGGLRRIGYEKTADIEATTLFRGIYGVGSKVAFKWYASGCRTLRDVKERKGGIVVSPVQELGLRFYDDINDRMPRSEAEQIFNMIKPIALKIDPKLFIEIMGSFRRGKADCGDIDILITRDYSDGKTHAGVLKQLLRELHRDGILTEDLSLPENFEDLEASYRGLCRRDPQSRRRRIDFLTVPYDSKGAALLYYTGDDIFNRSIRLKANKMGYSLNQRGLYAGVVRNPSKRTEKLSPGSIIASKTEEEILQILGVPWQEPHERVRG